MLWWNYSGYDHYKQWLETNFQNPGLMQFITTGLAILVMIILLYVAYKVGKEEEKKQIK